MSLNVGRWLQSPWLHPVPVPGSEGMLQESLIFLAHEKFPHSLCFPIFSWWLTVLLTSEKDNHSGAGWPACFTGPSLVSGSPCLQPVIQTLSLSLKPLQPVPHLPDLLQNLYLKTIILQFVPDESSWSEQKRGLFTCQYQRTPWCIWCEDPSSQQLS